MAKIIIRMIVRDPNCVLSIFHLRDGRLSWNAKGLLTTLLLIQGEFTIDTLTKLAANGNKETEAGLLELERYGYLLRKTCKFFIDPEIEYEYIVYDRPMRKMPLDTVAEIPGVEEITSAGKTVSPKSNEEETQISLRERLNLKKVAEKCSENFVETVFRELCRRDAEFRQIMTAKAFESVCLEVWKRQQSESISRLPDLIELIKMCFDNIALGIRSASGGNEPTVQKEMIENPLTNGYHRDK